MSVLLGIDLGDRRIGVALGNSATGVITPLLTLRRGTPGTDAATIARICDEQGASEVVVGLPLHLDGSESDQSMRTREWVSEMTSLIDRPIRFRDERRTSEAAKARMGRPPRGRSGGPPSSSTLRSWRARIDREAAAAIVQAEFDARLAAIEEPRA